MKQSNRILLLIVFGILIIIFIKLLPTVLFSSGKHNFENKNYIEAADKFKLALKFDPKNVDYRYFYVKTLAELQPTYYVQKVVYTFSKSKHEDGAKILANEIVTEWRTNIHQNIGANYIEQAPSGSEVVRWTKDSFPLKIYIDNEYLSKLPDYYKSAISRAFNQWDKSVDFISFKNVQSKKDANIQILFKPLPEDVCTNGICRYVLAYTTPKRRLNTLTSVSITLYDKNHAGEYFSDKEVYNTILHELGHALGIMGHSYNSGDLMYQATDETDKVFAEQRSYFNFLSGTDVNTMKLLYMLEPNVTNKKISNKSDLIYVPIILGSVQEIAQRKLKEANDYIKSSPKLAVGYINQAAAYSDLNEYQKAIKSLLHAEKLAKDDSEREIIYSNLAIIYQILNDNTNWKKYQNLANKYSYNY